MTLIIGIKLPKGILLVSDTREVDEKTDEIISDIKRKITIVTPTVFLAGSGSESNFYTSKILRNCLYNTNLRNSTTEIRENILKIYNQVNQLHKDNHVLGYPVGQLLLAEYDKELKEFNLLHQCGSVGFTEFNVLKKIKDVEVIGSNREVRNIVKQKVNNILASLTESELNHVALYEFIAKECHEIIGNLEIKSIGDNVYCTFLTEVNDMPASAVFFIDARKKLRIINAKDDRGEIQF